ncbi:MAG: hypothetical protein KW793_04390 [Candidatus Doudnabacteria bacterium]|nr:hypothetical protein [Candidatus Doudnabacteria bacterium]
MAWNTSILDLRTALSDGDEDRYNSRKRCFGEVNGTNNTFRTFEFRRITDFTAASAPIGVYINGTLLPAASISTDYIKTGEFVIGATGDIPVDGDIVEASYYNQWFLDAELASFLTVATNWLNSTTDVVQVPPGLQPAVLKYAQAEAYLKMAQRWRTWLSEMYKVEDEPKTPGGGPVESFIKMAESFRAEALAARKEFYSRQDRNLQPLFGSVLGNVRKMPGGV